jgi:hypothetical protein
VPALIQVARHNGWKLMTITKSACPVADVLPAPGDARDRACVTWRHRAWARIQALRPDLVIATSLNSYGFRNGSNARSKSDSAWRSALTRSLRKLGRGRTKVLVLGDVYPWSRGRDLSCLRNNKRNIGSCLLSRSSATAAFVRRRDKTEAAASRAAGATFRPTRHILCPYDPCPVIVDRMLLTRDGAHLSATYSREVWRALDRLMPDL